MTEIAFACLACHTCLEPLAAGEYSKLQCPIDGLVYEQRSGVWHFLAPGRAEYYQVYCEAPSDRQGNQRDTANLQALLKEIIGANSPPLTILDLGAGNGWLSESLAQLGHQLVAVDLLTTPQDKASFIPIQAEFDGLPFIDNQFDLVIFNAAFHFSEGYINTLIESMRILKADGRIIIMNSPHFQEKDDGVLMVNANPPVPGISPEAFLTPAWLDSLAELLFLEWRTIYPNFGLGYKLRQTIARLRTGRTQPQYPILIGKPNPNPQPSAKYADII